MNVHWTVNINKCMHMYDMKNISENEFLNFYFLNVDISINIHDLSLKLYRCIQYIAVEGSVSQNFYTGPS